MDGSPAALTPPIALTGGTGFVGRRFLAWWTARGQHSAGALRALTRRRPPAQAAGAPVTWVPGDLHDDAALACLVAGCRTVIHLAGATRAFDAAGFHAANAEGTRRLMRAVAQAADGDCRVIHVSSLAARAPQLSPYAASKRAGEELLAETLPPARWVILRPPALYGPGDRELLPLFAAARRGFLPVPGRADQRLALLYVDDLVALILRAGDPAFLAEFAGRRLEIDDGRGGYSYREMAEILTAFWGRPVRPVVIPRPIVAASAWLHQGWARIRRRPAMLAPHKLAELFHPDWSVSMPEELAAWWRPRHDLAAGLAAVRSADALWSRGTA